MDIVIFILILGILVMVHEFGHFIAAKMAGIKVEVFSLGFGPKLFKKKKGDTEYLICLFPLGGYVKLAGDNLDEYKGNKDEYLGKSLFARFRVIFFGPLLNYILGIVFLWFIFIVGYPALTTKVGDVVDNFGAQKAGIQAGDKITAVEGKKVMFWEDLQKEIQLNKSKKSLNVAYLRDGKEFVANIILKEESVADVLGQKKNVGLIGIKASDEMTKFKAGFFKSFYLSINKTIEITLMTYKSLWLMITRKMSVRDSVTGPLGMFYITSKAASVGFIALLHLVAVLSISLGLFNLLPFPALDGGHIVLLGIEKIRGKYLSKRGEAIFTNVGLSFIILLAVLVFINDLDRFGVISKVTKFFNRT